MRRVKLLEAWGMHVKGDWVAVMDHVAENLIKKGVARDPTVPAAEPEAPALEPESLPQVTGKEKVKTRRKKNQI